MILAQGDRIQHYKGGIYVVVGRATLCTGGEGDGLRLVLYRAADAPTAPHTFARPADEFSQRPTAAGGRRRFEPV